MAKARKSKPSGKKSKGGGSNLPAIFVILAIIAMIAIYAVKENPDWSKKFDSLTSSETIQKDKTTGNTTAKTQTSKNSQKETKNNTAENKSSQSSTSTTASRDKFDDKAINAQDGAKETAKINSNLPVYSEDDNYYYSSSFDFAWPAYTQDDQIVEHAYYTLRYNEKTEQADWVAYRLKAVDLNKSKFERSNNFRMDPDVKTKSASTSDYKGSGYDRGHLAPAADFSWTKDGMSESFFMSNMSPQEPGFNRGIWRMLEEKVRDWAKSNSEVYVVTGPIYNGKNEKIGKNKVVVPNQYFKVVLELNGKEVKGIGFILENKKATQSLSEYAMSIDDVEKVTGLDFFPIVPDQLENKIESTYNYTLWK
ncbi:MAG: DNA/RNA non-specific endonuclease [Reichenbachiella sp.]|uniref:DNA/RNA non-specific endonuclease n=1 Tax=Reichenbachiella sp. TaxID=2184521 RepID=UPI0032649ED8